MPLTFSGFVEQFKPIPLWENSLGLAKDYLDPRQNPNESICEVEGFCAKAKLIGARVLLLGKDFVEGQGSKILEAVTLCASVIKEAAPGTEFGEMGERLDRVMTTANGAFNLFVTMPAEGIKMSRTISELMQDWDNPHAIHKQAKRVKKLIFVHLAKMGKSICAAFRFMDKEMFSIGARHVRALGIAGAIFGIVSLVNSLFDNVMRGYYFVTTEDVVRAQDVAANAFSSVSNITYLALTILTLVTLVTVGVVISPWIPISLAVFAFSTSLISWFLERVGADANYCQKTWGNPILPVEISV